MKNMLSIGEASAMLGVSISTLRRWHKSGQLIPQLKTCGGHRRYSKVSKRASLKREIYHLMSSHFNELEGAPI